MITGVRQAVAILRSRWRFFTFVFTAGVIWSIYLLWSATPSYQSSATLFVSTPPTNGITNMSVAAMVTQERVYSYADLATDTKVLGPASKRLAGLSQSDLEDLVDVYVEENTLLLVVESRGDSPHQAQQITSVVTEELVSTIGRLEEPGDGDTELPFIVNVAADASLGTDPVEPNVPLGLGIGLTLSLLVAATATLLRHGLDTTVRSAADAAAQAGAPCLAALPSDSSATRGLSSSAPSGALSEAMRVLRSNLQFMELDGPRRTILITSAVEGAGRTTVALELASSLASASRSVLLVDLDLRHATLATTLQMPNDAGLVSILTGASELGAAIQRHSSGVHVLVSGTTPPNPAEILDSDAMRSLLVDLGRRYDMVILDGLAVLSSADSASLAHDVDAVLLVVDHGVTRRAQLKEAATRVRAAGGTLIGVVVNRAPGGQADGYGYAAALDEEESSSAHGRRARRD